MKTRLLAFLFLILICSSKQTLAQQGTMKWRFASRSQVVPALEKTRGNLRATYEVLMCAVRQGYSRTALGYYENIVAGHEFAASSKDSAAYSFAFDLCDGPRPWHWGRDRALREVKKSSRASAQYFRERAMKMSSGSPEVLLMTSFYGLYQGDMKERGQAYQNLVKATKRAPTWADAHFWLGMAATTYAMSYETRILDKEVTPITKPQYQAAIKRLGAISLRAYDRAEKLDPGLRPYLFAERLFACQQAETKKCAKMIPLYVEAHLRAFPEFPAWYLKQTGENEIQYRKSWQGIANRMAASATS